MDIRRKHTGNPEYGKKENPDIQEAGNKARENADYASQKAQEVSGTAQQKAREVYHDVEDRGKNMVDEQKHSLAGEIGVWGSALHDTADKLRQRRDPMADIPDNAARFLDKASHYLDEKTPEDMLRDTNDYARHHPLMVVGGMFAAGLVLARVLKAVPAGHEKLERDSEPVSRDDPSVKKGESYGI